MYARTPRQRALNGAHAGHEEAGVEHLGGQVRDERVHPVLHVQQQRLHACVRVEIKHSKINGCTREWTSLTGAPLQLRQETQRWVPPVEPWHPSHLKAAAVCLVS